MADLILLFYSCSCLASSQSRSPFPSSLSARPLHFSGTPATHLHLRVWKKLLLLHFPSQINHGERSSRQYNPIRGWLEQCNQNGGKFVPSVDGCISMCLWSLHRISKNWHFTHTFIVYLNHFTPQAIDVLERTLDNGFDTSFEPKEYIRIYTWVNEGPLLVSFLWFWYRAPPPSPLCSALF